VAQTARWLHSSRRDGVLAREHADTTSAEAAHSPYLRATLYLDTDKMDAGRWYELALLLWRRSSSWLYQSAVVKVCSGSGCHTDLARTRTSPSPKPRPHPNLTLTLASL
jgi:hypothetical protein